MKPDWMNASEAETGVYVFKKTTNTIVKMGTLWLVAKGEQGPGPNDRVYGPIPPDDNED